MRKRTPQEMSRRERQIMDVIFQRGKATVTEVLEAMPDPPSYSAVRALMGILEEKGLLTHTQDGPRYTYSPTQPRDNAGRQAIKRVLQTFYDGSIENAVAALLDVSESSMSDEEMKRISELIAKAREDGL